MVFLCFFLALALPWNSRAFPATSVAVRPSPDVSTVGFGPNIAAHQARKLYFGTATNNDELNDTAYFALLDNLTLFGQLTPAKAMKWVRLLSTVFATV